MTAAKTFGVWAGLALVAFCVVVLVDTDSGLREPRNLWVIPVASAFAGASVVLRQRVQRAARRRGAEARGMTLEEADAEGRAAERRFRARHPVLYGLLLVGAVALAGLAIWLKIAL